MEEGRKRDGRGKKEGWKRDRGIGLRSKVQEKGKGVSGGERGGRCRGRRSKSNTKVSEISKRDGREN